MGRLRHLIDAAESADDLSLADVLREIDTQFQGVAAAITSIQRAVESIHIPAVPEFPEIPQPISHAAEIAELKDNTTSIYELVKSIPGQIPEVTIPEYKQADLGPMADAVRELAQLIPNNEPVIMQPGPPPEYSIEIVERDNFGKAKVLEARIIND